MSVEFISCEICGHIFPDCGDYGNCGNCESQLCSSCRDKQVKKYGCVEEDSPAANDWGEDSPAKCDLCSGLIIQDWDIIEHLLAKNKTTKDEVIAEIKKARGL